MDRTGRSWSLANGLQVGEYWHAQVLGGRGKLGLDRPRWVLRFHESGGKPPHSKMGCAKLFVMRGGLVRALPAKCFSCTARGRFVYWPTLSGRFARRGLLARDAGANRHL